jgi:hypothetical protein
MFRFSQLGTCASRRVTVLAIAETGGLRDDSTSIGFELESGKNCLSTRHTWALGKMTDDGALIGCSHKGSMDNVEIAHGVVLDSGHVNVSVSLPRF